MRHFWVISIFPEIFVAISDYGITGRAIKNHQASLTLINPRDFTTDTYRRIDDKVFGGGPGMVMLAEPLSKAIRFAKNDATIKGCQNCPVVYLSPQGVPLSETWVVNAKETFDGLILVCGRYEGIDERIIKSLVNIELSVGDYVLTGGELPAMVVLDALIRRLPSVMNDAQSAEQDSFVGGLLDCPHYAKPVDFEGQSVPEVLLSGHHHNIAKWRFFKQLQQTQDKRPALFATFLQEQADSLDKTHKNWLTEFLQNQS